MIGKLHNRITFQSQSSVSDGAGGIVTTLVDYYTCWAQMSRNTNDRSDIAGKGAGIDGERSGMWKHMARIISEVDPAFTFIENSPMLRTRGLGVVLNDLNSLGFDAKWGCVSASAVGANHKRDRIWVVGKSKRKGLEGQRGQPRKKKITQFGDASTLAHTEDQGDVWRQWQLGFAEQEHDSGRGKADGGREWWKAEPNVGRVVDGVASRVDRLKAIGNGQVPLCAATAWRLLSK